VECWDDGVGGFVVVDEVCVGLVSFYYQGFSIEVTMLQTLFISY
jgi:hypothetical protein